jgi:hypothetical protein
MANHCLNCQSKNISFIEDVEIPYRGKCKLYSCNACGIQFLLDSEGKIVEDY